MSKEFKPGKLVKYRHREWIVMPSSDSDLLVLKPLGGSEDETTAIFLPLKLPGEKVEETTFPTVTSEQLGDFETGKLLFDATRLSFRNASGPFRCMGKLSFRPRSYQIVPLVMALKQDIVRLLVADDVGIGKTIEALVILKELIERGDVKNFAVICLPHLCEQWQKELKDKLDIDAEIIRSSTAASLDRKLPDDRSVFYHFPYQVISIDYIKSDKRKNLFLNDCPDLVIVDEAHTCTKPAGATSPTQQQRYHLLHDIAKKENQHLILLTATPHSGKDEEFQSLLGLLNKEFEAWDLENIDQNKRRKLAKYFVQRKRENIKRWLKEHTIFPERESKEIGYKLSQDYLNFYQKVLNFARGLSRSETGNRARIRYWAALALLRGVMSSPAMGAEMLTNRQNKALDSDDLQQYLERPNPLFEKLEEDSDSGQPELMENSELDVKEETELEELSREITYLKGKEKDYKAAKAIEIVKLWLKQGFNPIIFCKYIATAKYLGELLKEELPAKTDLQVITSELADDQRKEKIQAMEESSRRVLVATDCLSEGINLQNLFTAVLHYDLPWNPNRIEQREGRVDRFGQQSPIVKTYLIWGEDNPIDRTVLKVLINKVRDIQKTTGVAISLGEENTSIMDAVIKDVLMGEQSKTADGQQLSMFAEETITNELELAKKKAENLRSIFAHESIPPSEIEQGLEEVDEAIGDISTVETFVTSSITLLKGTVVKDEQGYVADITNLPPHLKSYFKGNKVKISFHSPTPAGYRYIGRNHLFTEQLCQMIISRAFQPSNDPLNIARAAVVRTEAVSTKKTLVQFRVRNVIKEVNGKREIISEEMFLWGYTGSGPEMNTLSYQEAKTLLLEATSASNISLEQQKSIFENEQSLFEEKARTFYQVAEERAQNLVEAHGRFKELVGGKRYEAVHPVLPPDIIGVYILLPVPKSLK